MLRMIGGELRKLLPLRILLLIVVLLFANLAMSVIYQKEQAKEQNNAYIKDHIEFLLAIEQALEADPEGTIEYYAALDAEYDQQYTLWESAQDPFAEGVQTFDFIAPHTYSEKLNDYEAFEIYFKAANDFPRLLGDIIAQAEYNSGLLGSLGIHTQSNVSSYQTQVAEIYKDLLAEIDPTLHLSLGWNNWFGYDYGMLLVFLAALILVLQSGLCDQDSRMESILRIAKRGRWQRGFARICALGISLGVVVLLMRLCDLAVFAVPMGLTNPLHLIQTVSVMTYCPYAISILTGVLLELAGLMLTAFCFSLVCLFCIAFARNAFVTILLGGGLIAGNLLLYWLELGWLYQFFNLFSLASGDLLLRCPSVNQIHMGKSLYPYSVVLYLILVIYLALLLPHLTGMIRPHMKMRKNRKEKNRKLRRKGEASDMAPLRQVRQLRIRQVGLLTGEFAKRFSLLTVILLVALIILHAVQSYNSVTAGRSDGEGKIISLIDQYGNRVTEESHAAMQAHLDRDLQLVNGGESDRYMSEYLAGNITYDVYSDYMVECAQAQAEVSILTKLVSHSSYLLSLEEKGIKTQLFYDGGYLNLFGRNFDVAYYLIIVLLSAAAFAYEYNTTGKGGMAMILRSTKQGRIPAFTAKLRAAVMSAIAIGLLFTVYDLVVFLNRYGTSGMSSPLVCIERYANFNQTLTVGGYIAIYFALRLLAGILLALWITALSCIIPSVKINLPLIAAVTLFPFTLTYFGLSVCKYFDYTAFLDADRLLYTAVDLGNGYLMIFLITVIVGVMGTIAWSARKFCK